jgi:hypothetical protein
VALVAGSAACCVDYFSDAPTENTGPDMAFWANFSARPISSAVSALFFPEAISASLDLKVRVLAPYPLLLEVHHPPHLHAARESPSPSIMVYPWAMATPKTPLPTFITCRMASALDGSRWAEHQSPPEKVGERPAPFQPGPSIHAGPKSTTKAERSMHKAQVVALPAKQKSGGSLFRHFSIFKPAFLSTFLSPHTGKLIRQDRS